MTVERLRKVENETFREIEYFSRIEDLGDTVDNLLIIYSCKYPQLKYSYPRYGQHDTDSYLGLSICCVMTGKGIKESGFRILTRE